jgi:UDP-GlcNAc:undecaprenyl-phosphate GlcNAc-1-phosphate transferase
VSVIYAVQMFLVMCAVLLRYESDLLLTAIYLGTCSLMFALIYCARHRGYRAHAGGTLSVFARAVESVKLKLVSRTLLHGLAVVVLLVLLSFSALADMVPRDIGVGSLVLGSILAVYLLFFAHTNDLIGRVIVFVAVAFAVYVETRFGTSLVWWRGTPEIVFFAIIGIATGLATRLESDAEFNATPTDFLVLFLVLAAGVLAWLQSERLALGAMAAKIAILFYAVELIQARLTRAPRVLYFGSIAAFTILAVRGLL